MNHESFSDDCLFQILLHCDIQSILIFRAICFRFSNLNLNQDFYTRQIQIYPADIRTLFIFSICYNLLPLFELLLPQTQSLWNYNSDISSWPCCISENWFILHKRVMDIAIFANRKQIVKRLLEIYSSNLPKSTFNFERKYGEILRIRNLCGLTQKLVKLPLVIGSVEDDILSMYLSILIRQDDPGDYGEIYISENSTKGILNLLIRKITYDQIDIWMERIEKFQEIAEENIPNGDMNSDYYDYFCQELLVFLCRLDARKTFIHCFKKYGNCTKILFERICQMDRYPFRYIEFFVNEFEMDRTVLDDLLVSRCKLEEIE